LGLLQNVQYLKIKCHGRTIVSDQGITHDFGKLGNTVKEKQRLFVLKCEMLCMEVLGLDASKIDQGLLIPV
jgi:hypothetical protein